ALSRAALSGAVRSRAEFPRLYRSGVNGGFVGKSWSRRSRTRRAIRWGAPAWRTPTERRFCGLRLFLSRTEPLYQDAAALPVGHEAGALVGHVVCNLEVVTPGAAISAAQWGVILAPGIAAAWATCWLIKALVAVAAGFAKWPAVVPDGSNRSALAVTIGARMI